MLLIIIFTKKKDDSDDDKKKSPHLTTFATFFSDNLKRGPITLTYKRTLVRIKTNRQPKYLGQGSFSLKVYCPDTYRHTSQNQRLRLVRQMAAPVGRQATLFSRLRQVMAPGRSLPLLTACCLTVKRKMCNNNIIIRNVYY